MGICQYCGGDAGVFRKVHKQCGERADSGRAQLLAAVAQSVFGPVESASFMTYLGGIAKESLLGDADIRLALVSGWERAVDAALEDDVFTSDEERSLVEFAATMGLSQDDLDVRGAYMRVVKAAVIRDVLDGGLPQRLGFDGPLPFNLQKGEVVVWVFPGVTYHEQQTRTEYVGGSQGMSVCVMSGVYYRVGGFRGHPVQTSGTVSVSNGLLGVTDKHIYFASPQKTFRIKYDKIVAFTPYSDGIGLQRDAQTAKPESFTTGDGWFTYNLIANLASR